MKIMKTITLKTAFTRHLRSGIWVLPPLIILCAASAHAQTGSSPKPELPPGPPLAPAPSFSQWIVTFSYPEERAKSENPSGFGPGPVNVGTRTKKITTTKTEEIVHEEFVDGLGGKFDQWHVGPILYIKSSGSNTWGQIEASRATDRGIDTDEVLPANGFRGLGWIARDNYAGTVKYSGRNCLLFVLGAPPHLDLSNPDSLKKLESLNAVAFVDAESRLPVEAGASGVIRYFQFADAPSDKLTLPPDLAQQIQQGEEGRARLEQRLPRPY